MIRFTSMARRVKRPPDLDTAAGARTEAVTMQLERRLALTPALSPRERENQSRCLGRPPRGDRLQHGENGLPLLGERAGVRAGVLFVCIDTAKVRARWVWLAWLAGAR